MLLGKCITKMGMSYRNKLLFIVIVAVAIIASVIIAISWMNSNEDIKRLREHMAFMRMDNHQVFTPIVYYS